MTRERRDRIEEIAIAVAGFRAELLSMRIDEIHELSTVTDYPRYESSCEHITEIRKATEFFHDGLRELGY